MSPVRLLRSQRAADGWVDMQLNTDGARLDCTAWRKHPEDANRSLKWRWVDQSITTERRDSCCTRSRPLDSAYGSPTFVGAASGSTTAGLGFAGVWTFPSLSFKFIQIRDSFFRRVVMLVVEHALFGAAAATTFLPADFLDAGALGIHVAFLEGFDLVEQEPAGEKAVESLLARGLAFDLKTRWPVEQHHAGGGLVDVLAAVSAGTDKRLVDVGFAHAERGHALGELDFLLRADRERAHGVSVAVGRCLDKGRQSCYVDCEIWNKVCPFGQGRCQWKHERHLFKSVPVYCRFSRGGGRVPAGCRC